MPFSFFFSERTMTSYRHLRHRLLLLSIIIVLAFIAFIYISTPSHMTTVLSQLIKARLNNKVGIYPQGTHTQSKSWVLLAAVYSSPEDEVMRKAVRETWGQYLNIVSKSQLLFFISRPNEKTTRDKLSEEESTYKDIVQLDFIDSFKNQSLRSISIFQWVVNSGNKAQFFLRADVKAFVNIPKLVDLIKGISAKKYMLGRVTEKSKPERSRDSPWYVSTDEYPTEEFPRYLQSYGYLMTGNLIGPLLEVDKFSKRFWVEDVYITGILAKQLGVAIIHSNYFTHTQPANKCEYSKIIVCLCGSTYNSMKEVYTQVEMPDEKCSY